MVSGLSGHCHEDSKPIQYRSLLVMLRFLVRICLVEHDLECDHALVSGIDGDYLVVFVYFGAGFIITLTTMRFFCCNEIPSIERWKQLQNCGALS